MFGRRLDGHRRPSLSRPPRDLRRLGQRRHPGPAAALAGHRRRGASRSSPATRCRPAASCTSSAAARTFRRRWPPGSSGRRPCGPLARAVDGGRPCWRCAPGCRSWAPASSGPTASRPTAWVWSTASPGGAGARGPWARSWCEPGPGLGSAAAQRLREPRRRDLGRARGDRRPGGSGAGSATATGPATDGVWAGRVFGTYLHGPVLARNPALADLLLGWVVGELAPLDDPEEQALRAERLAAAGRRRLAPGRAARGSPG